MEKAVEIDPQALESWKQLYSRWSKVHSRARKARFDANIALLKCAYGVGPPPTRTQLIRVKRMEDDAEMLRVNMDAKVLSMSGVEWIEDAQARLTG